MSVNVKEKGKKVNLINTYLSPVPECVSCLFTGGSLPDRHNGQRLVMVSQRLADQAPAQWTKQRGTHEL